MMVKRRTALVVLVSMLAFAGGCNSDHRRVGRKVIVLGFDGLDYDVTRSLIDAGKLPAFARLASAGGFAPLGTTIPPQSPVAWSSFITGLDPGRHGIFDFVHRDPKTMQPYLSTTKTEAASRTLRIGRWQLPLSRGRVELLRRGQPFWDVLEQRGVPTTIIRMPANFPPSGTATRELSGMGTPDLSGTYGTFTFFSSAPFGAPEQSVSGGILKTVTLRNGTVESSLAGPENPFLRTPEPVESPFTAYVDRDSRHVKLVLGDEERLLTVGEWSDWVPISFSLAPTQTLAGEVRFYLKALDPFFEMYASPVNIDPLDAAMPISHPPSFASELAAATGRFYTQGMPEDTKAFKGDVLSAAEFLAQARIAGDENKRQFQYVLDRFDDGLLFYYFGNVDQVSHMMWRARDPGHPAYDPAADAPYANVIDELYQGFDAIVSEALSRAGTDGLVVVMSDHGFTSWRRSFNLNSWLRDNGYLTAIDPSSPDDAGLFGNVDWSRTRAYGLGLNGLYVNLKGRERDGIVQPGERDALLKEIAAKLEAVVDPKTGSAAVTTAYRREQVYQTTGTDDIAPDLIVGYAKGTRSSDESALGGLPREVFADNTSHWSGDHCMDRDAVPGILLSSRQLRKPAPTLETLAAAILAEFGVQDFPLPNDDR